MRWGWTSDVTVLRPLLGAFRVPFCPFLFSLPCTVIPDMALILTLGPYVRDLLDLGSVERCHMTLASGGVG